MKLKQHIQTGFISCGFVAGLAFSAQAQGAANITDAEFAMLPPYCAVKMRTHDPAASQSWDAQLGHENWIHMHHYCDALVEVNRAQHSNAYERKRALDNATGQFDYVLKNTRPDFFMRPDFHYRKGLSLQLKNAEGAAIAEFRRAVEIKADFAPALIELVKFYKKTGKKDMALSALKQGLEKSPTNKSLRSRFQELGGDLSTIPVAVEPLNEPSKPVESDGGIAEQPATKAASTPDNNQPMISSPSGQKIGNAKNPWCRFCTDEETSIENK